MKFSSGLDALEKENQNLRFLLKLMVLSLGLLALAVIVIGNKDPVMVEQTDHGVEFIKPVKLKRSEDDVRHVVELMLRARFNTDVTSPNIYLSDRQMELREAEQRELKARNLKQAIILRSVKIEQHTATIDFDRVIAVQEIRSALRTLAKIELEEEDPNELNPYGLRLATLETLENKEVKK